MDNLPPFSDACFCYRPDEFEVARASGLEVRCGPGLPCSCSMHFEFDAAADPLFGNEASTEALSAWDPLTAAPCHPPGTPGCSGPGTDCPVTDGFRPHAHATTNACANTTTPISPSADVCDSGCGTSSKRPPSQHERELRQAASICRCTKLHNLDAKRKRCCGDSCACDSGCVCPVTSGMKCCDNDLGEVLRKAAASSGASSTAAAPKRSPKQTPPQPPPQRCCGDLCACSPGCVCTKPATGVKCCESGQIGALAALHLASGSESSKPPPLTVTLQNASTAAHAHAPPIAQPPNGYAHVKVMTDPTELPVDEVLREGVLSVYRPCCTSHAAVAHSLYAGTPLMPTIPAAGLPVHCGQIVPGGSHGCAICGKWFRTQDELETHSAKVHHALRPYKCNQCGTSFLFKQNRDRHIVEVHQGRRPHLCPHPDCEAAFKNSSGLKQHLRTVHQKQRPFKCPHCPSSFGQRNHLTQHILVVHEKRKLFKCDVCGSSFSNRGNLNQHRRRKHPEVVGKSSDGKKTDQSSSKSTPSHANNT